MISRRPWRAPLTALLPAAGLSGASLLAGCGGQSEPTRLDAAAMGRDNVVDVVAAYSDELSSQDWDGLLELFWPGATVSAIRRPDTGGDPRVEVTNVTDRIAEMAPILESKPLFEQSLESPAVFVEHSLAMVWAPSATRIGAAADPAKVRGVDALTLLRVGDTWGIMSLAYQADDVENPLPEGGSRQSILTTLERYYSDFSGRNWSRLSTHFSPDATISAVRQPAAEGGLRAVVWTVPEFIESVRGVLERESIFEVRMGTAQVLVRGNLAQVWARYHVRLGDARVSEWDSTNAFTLIRARNRWRVVSLSYDTEAPAAARFNF